MSSLFTSYDEMEATPIEWLDELPVGWRSVGMCFTCYIRARLGWKGLKANEYIEDGFIFLATPNIKGKLIDFDKVNYISEQRYEESPEIKLNIGDVLLTKDGSTIGTANVVRELPRPATVNSSIAVLSPSEGLLGLYLFYCVKSEWFQNVISRLQGGMGVPHLFQSDLNKIVIPVPSVQEQQKIAQFLDVETAKIDTLIEKQQQLIALLKEKRQAVISHAVTKGLDPDAPLHDSGVEWLGEVPVGWVVAKLSYRYEVLLGKMLDERKISGNYLKPYLRNTDVQWGKVNSLSLPEMDFRPEECERFSVKKGDLLVCEGGEVGRAALWNHDDVCFYQKALHRLRPIQLTKDSSRFFYYHMENAAKAERFSGGLAKATIAHLPAESFRQYVFCFPQLEVQLQIADYLDKKDLMFNHNHDLANKAIELLQEKKSALISAAVTGKIDVRDWQPPSDACHAETL